MDGFLPVLARKSRFLRRQRARFHPFSLVGLHAGQPEPIPNRIWNYRRVLETDGIAIMQEGARKGFVSPVGVCENACNIAPVLTHDRGMEDCDPAVEQVEVIGVSFIMLEQRRKREPRYSSGSASKSKCMIAAIFSRQIASI